MLCVINAFQADLLQCISTAAVHVSTVKEHGRKGPGGEEEAPQASVTSIINLFGEDRFLHHSASENGVVLPKAPFCEALHIKRFLIFMFC